MDLKISNWIKLIIYQQPFKYALCDFGSCFIIIDGFEHFVDDKNKDPIYNPKDDTDGLHKDYQPPKNIDDLDIPHALIKHHNNNTYSRALPWLDMIGPWYGRALELDPQGNVLEYAVRKWNDDIRRPIFNDKYNKEYATESKYIIEPRLDPRL